MHEVEEWADVSTTISIRSGAIFAGIVGMDVGDSPEEKLYVHGLHIRMKLVLFSQPDRNCGNNEMPLFYYYFF